MSFIRSYLFRLICGAVLSAVALNVPLKPAIRKVLTVSCGCMMILLVLSPLAGQSIDAWLRQMPSDFDLQLEEQKNRNSELLQKLICEQTQACIEQKAKQYGIELHADVKVKYDETVNSYLPYSAVLTVYSSRSGLDALQLFLTEELEIPKERQTWRLK